MILFGVVHGSGRWQRETAFNEDLIMTEHSINFLGRFRRLANQFHLSLLILLLILFIVMLQILDLNVAPVCQVRGNRPILLSLLVFLLLFQNLIVYGQIT